jgi:hypothetical protein
MLHELALYRVAAVPTSVFAEVLNVVNTDKPIMAITSIGETFPDWQYQANLHVTHSII